MAVTPTRDPAGLVQLIDNDSHDVLGEVQDSPTTNTMLDRLKAILTGLSSVVISGVTSPSTGGSGKATIAVNSIKQALAAISTPMSSGVTMMTPSTNSGDVTVFRNAIDSEGYLLVAGGGSLFYEQADLANILVSGTKDDVVHFIWS